MKKLLYFLVSISTLSTAFAVNRTWLGTTNDWANAANWSPSGVPGSADILTIEAKTNAPTIYNGTSATVIRIFLQSNAQLTISTGASLTITNASPSSNFPNGITMNNASFNNNGTLTINQPSPGSVSVGIELTGSSVLQNSGTMDVYALTSGIQLSGTSSLTNNSTGVMNVSSNRAIWILSTSAGATIVNNNIINCTSTSGGFGFNLSAGSLSNSGTMNFLAGNGFYSDPATTTTNLSCGKMIFNNAASSNMDNRGSVTNNGLIQIYNSLKNSGTITNNGIIKYESLQTTGGGAITNNGIVIDDKTDPIVQVGTTNSASILGIYTNEATTTIAGTFTTPDQFSPDGLLPGDKTLYAKIAPAGNGCEYIVPFLYTVSALPVTLVQFSGKNNGNGQNTLTWLTSDEKDFGYFEIQRSSDARSFEAIGSVVASEQVNALKSYQFVDSRTLGMNYYRLKMVDHTDGNYQFSKIISVLNSVENNIVGSFYPNPSNGPVFVDVYAEASESWQIQVFDANGKMITTESRVLQKGMNKVTLTNLAKGLNIVQFENSKSSISRKLVRQ